MVDKVNIELDGAFLKKFFALTEKEIPEGQEITMSILRRQLDEIEVTIEDAKEEAKKAGKPAYVPPSQPSASALNAGFDGFGSNDGFNLPKKHILIIDDLGVITYQLEVLFKQFGFDVTG